MTESTDGQPTDPLWSLLHSNSGEGKEMLCTYAMRKPPVLSAARPIELALPSPSTFIRRLCDVKTNQDSLETDDAVWADFEVGLQRQVSRPSPPKRDFITGAQACNLLPKRQKGEKIDKKEQPRPRGPGMKRGISGTNAPSFVKKALEENTEEDPVSEALQGIDPKLIEMIENEMMSTRPNVTWDDIAGLAFAKQCVMEIVVWPLLRPDIFKGLRGPPKGILLFGPPGTGKTMIGKAIAHESKSTFFSISSSSLTSKWHGEGEKLVKTLFAVASCHQPAVIFIDEIDSLLSQRNESEFEGSRRLKTEFLVQLDGARTSGAERILVVGATNRPQELDEAARRRLVKSISYNALIFILVELYIPLPDEEGRESQFRRLVRNEKHSLADADFQLLTQLSVGYSGADISALCTEAAYEPIRELAAGATSSTITSIDPGSVRPITVQDFKAAFSQVRASVSEKDLEQYIEWNATYGSFKNPEGAS